MALNSPSNLKLGHLGHIAGGNANSTSQTSLASTCRGSAASTRMWADFKIGGVTVTNTKVSGNVDYSGSKGEFGMRFKGDVGEYMGATGGNQLIEENLLTQYIDSNDYASNVEATEASPGSFYQDRIANRSTNSSDYEGNFDRTHGDVIINFQSSFTEKDKLRANAV